MAELEARLNKAGSKIVQLDMDGNLSLTASSNSDGLNK